jgi:hypothetical protein
LELAVGAIGTCAATDRYIRPNPREIQRKFARAQKRIKAADILGFPGILQASGKRRGRTNHKFATFRIQCSHIAVAP